MYKGDVGMAALIGASMLGLSVAIAADLTPEGAATWDFWIIVVVATVLQPVALLVLVAIVWVVDELRGPTPRPRTGGVHGHDRGWADVVDNDGGGDSGD